MNDSMAKKISLFVGSILLAASITFVACADDKPENYKPSFKSSGNVAFDNWRNDFATRAVKNYHKDPVIIDSMLNGLTPNQTVLSLNDSQPELIKPIWQYINSAVSSQKISMGRSNYLSLLSKLSPDADKYGVPSEVAVAIWGMETSYGANKGSMDVVRALATLAYQGRRTELGETELLAVADILQNGYATRGQLIGSWAGAMGHTQFMPTSYMSKAVDGDGDGRKNIWTDPIDALASTMNFLKVSGWKKDEPWGAEAMITNKAFDYSLADGQMHPLSFWKSKGIKLKYDTATWSCVKSCSNPDNWQAYLLLPAGANGPAFLLGNNYKAIRAYNASDSYALSVALLSSQIAKKAPMPNSWPVNEPPLKRSDAIAMQTILNKLGFDVGIIDGAPGAKTKAALQTFQKQHNLLADGYPSQKSLADLKAISSGGKVTEAIVSGNVVTTPVITVPVIAGPQNITINNPSINKTIEGATNNSNKLGSTEVTKPDENIAGKATKAGSKIKEANSITKVENISKSSGDSEGPVVMFGPSKK